MKKKILIYGVGPFGSLFAERLAEAGHSVFLLDHGERQQELKSFGIVIENTATGAQTVTHLPVVEQLAPEDHYDLVIVPMRKNRVYDIVPALAANKTVPTFLFMMNNAAGHEEFIESLGVERVMAGFPLPGGFKKGHVMHMLPVKENKPTVLPIGEVDGSITARTREVAAILDTMRGFRAEIRTDIDAWLKTHVAILVPTLAPALYACNSDLVHFAMTRDAQVLMKRALHEALLATKKAGVPITPPGIRLMDWVPEPLFVLAFSKADSSATLKNAVGHLRTARDEVEHLTNEFYAMIHPGHTPTPTMDQLTEYSFGFKDPLPAGSNNIPLRWGPVYGAVAGIAATVGLVVLLRRRNRSIGDE
ncbi:2-dehydropantoate 2-reductase N-terminal domain-containing protein [Planococcus sp. ISL-109]|uniref:ketopantoate reductase family protein n=1 Tax=Planococcus sp. ISL-109 TaxID=2819166 RepID=UPI001BEB43B4|nr:2-dehydropantoate 2-reductase N-terminal domain-containing protein [Planococcus sp. ISL-109]MBT2581198.1 ketopantoate reductase family protein [Planococcus sp. ISL-109]